MTTPRHRIHGFPLFLRVVLFAGLALLYVAGAGEHARRVNTFKARGDQSGYLGDAERVYANWHGHRPRFLIGERNRMPVYAGYLALFYHPSVSDDEYFVIAKTWNVRLSLVLLAVLCVIFSWYLPPVVSTNLTLIVAFGAFVYKAGYAQADLLFYFTFFLTFLGCWHLLGPTTGRRAVSLAALTGAAAGLAHLTKAAILPLVGGAVLVHAARPVAGLVQRWRGKGTDASEIAWRAAATAAVVALFLAALWPYLATSKRVFGHYFYNVNSTFYVWYDDWPAASVGTYSHGDGVGWPDMPVSDLPGPRRYWREHTIGQIAARVGNGFEDMLVVSYRTYGFLPYLALYGGMLAVIAGTHRGTLRHLARANGWRVLFLVCYGLVYLVATAFYHPTSGTGTARFLLAHLMPLLFVLSRLFSNGEVRQLSWRLGGVPVTMGHFHLLVSATLALDIAFRLWPRLMTTYGGF